MSKKFRLPAVAIYYDGGDNWRMQSEMEPHALRLLLESLIASLPDQCPKCSHSH